jgi:hypothetical protein
MTKATIGGWTLLARIAANPAAFDACDTTAALSALLLVRSQLVQGVDSGKSLKALAEVVGDAAMREVIDNLASYEALRVVDNIGAARLLGSSRSAAAARRCLLSVLEAPDRVPEPMQAPPEGAPSSEETFVAPPMASRALRRHRAMGARRVRPAG